MPRPDVRVPGAAAAALLAVDPRGLGGAVVRGSARHHAEEWATVFGALLPADAPQRRLPAAIADDRLVGGLDVAATLAAGRVVVERGVLAAADGGAIVLAAAGTRAATWAHVARALDAGAVGVERDGLAAVHRAEFVAIALDDGEETCVPAAFTDRVAFLVDLAADDPDDAADGLRHDAASVAAARVRLDAVRCDDAALEAVCRGAESLGIASPRVALAALAAARASAALDARDRVTAADLARAARLVLAPRATVLPDAPPDAAADDTPDPPDATPDDTDAASLEERSADPPPDPADAPGDERAGPLTDVVVRAVRAALPAGLLAAAAARASHTRLAAGRAGAEGGSATRGRQVGTRRGDPRGGARLDLVATLRVAAPFQRLRRAEAPSRAGATVSLRRDDLRVRRCAAPTRTTTVFVVDTSGSAALHRLAEAKGAVEVMLAEGYARRERVAVIVFRGTTADLVLAPTHALARARRAVAGLPAGGGTPLAAALDRAAEVARGARRDGSQVVVVLLTDGRANVARDGRGGRARAETDALAAATALRAVVDGAVLVDTATRPERFAHAVADALGARHVALPATDARGVVSLARSANAPAAAGR